MSDKMSDKIHGDPETAAAPGSRNFVHRVLRYVPNPLREEWVNIGVLLYDPSTGERRLRLIEEEAEYDRVHRLHPRVDEASLRGLRDHLESRFAAALPTNGNAGGISNNAPGSGHTPGSSPGTSRSTLHDGAEDSKPDTTEWLAILEKWDATLSQSLQLADPKATIADDINAEIDRLYNERVAVGRSFALARPSRPSTRDQMRNYMDQVLRQANIWNRIEKFVTVANYTLDDDPMLIDYSYWRNDSKRGFVQTISLSHKPEDAKVFAYTAKKIQDRASHRHVGVAPEFTAVTDTDFRLDNQNHKFLKQMLGNNGVEHIALDGLAVWAAKLRPMLQ